MIMCACTTEVDGIVARGGCRHPPSPRRKSGEGRRRADRDKKRIVAYVTINDRS